LGLPPSDPQIGFAPVDQQNALAMIEREPPPQRPQLQFQVNALDPSAFMSRPYGG
jgi:hypothetical protein